MGGAATGKKGRGYLVDPGIGALGGKNGGEEELERVGVMKFAVSVGVGALELGNDEANSFGQ